MLKSLTFKRSIVEGKSQKMDILIGMLIVLCLLFRSQKRTVVIIPSRVAGSPVLLRAKVSDAEPLENGKSSSWRRGTACRALARKIVHQADPLFAEANDIKGTRKNMEAHYPWLNNSSEKGNYQLEIADSAN